MSARMPLPRHRFVDIIAETLAAKNEWADDGQEYADPEEWRVEADHIVETLTPWLRIQSERAAVPSETLQ